MIYATHYFQLPSILGYLICMCLKTQDHYFFLFLDAINDYIKLNGMDLQWDLPVMNRKDSYFVCI